jgi:2-hydroxychromene-2-carboxylate isomerase
MPKLQGLSSSAPEARAIEIELDSPTPVTVDEVSKVNLGSLLDAVIDRAEGKIPLSELIEETELKKDSRRNSRGSAVTVVNPSKTVSITKSFVVRGLATKKPTIELSRESLEALAAGDETFSEGLATEEAKTIVKHIFQYGLDPDKYLAAAGLACTTCGIPGDSKGWHWYRGTYIPITF